MLRNVAIPLMLAASEAEAQTPEQIKAAAFAMKMDKDFKIPELEPASNELNEC
jgi:flagellar biosynthesis regulator FlaF